MTGKERLGDLRKQIDEIDGKLIALFQERMYIAKETGEIKGMNNLAITDEAREQQVVNRAEALAGGDLKGEASMFMRSVIAISKEQQRKSLFPTDAPLLPPPRKPVRDRIVCAYRGVPGGWSEEALIKLFPEAGALQTDLTEDVFLAVKDKKAHYGIAAIENSKTGAIGETYDLLRKYGCFIVGRTAVNIQDCLLAREGVELSDIREVYSHPYGFRDCANFLRGRAWDLNTCHNMDESARTAAAEKSGRAAAIGSRRIAELNGLQVLSPNIMNSDSNKTSFVVISPEPEYDASDDLISVTFSTQHRSGALCETLLPFMAGGINLTRIESRPGGLDKYRFFAEIQGNILDGNTISVLRYAAAASEYFEVIGCYSTT
ncbi:MAG: chorismate mutase [Peptococcaceae bacterium]|jgi:chorismate mutase/prephenate dehydratase|nr:chorismate mutase [Peptococcaceae bacterium]